MGNHRENKVNVHFLENTIYKFDTSIVRLVKKKKKENANH